MTSWVWLGGHLSSRRPIMDGTAWMARYRFANTARSFIECPCECVTKPAVRFVTTLQNHTVQRGPISNPTVRINQPSLSSERLEAHPINAQKMPTNRAWMNAPSLQIRIFNPLVWCSLEIGQQVRDPIWMVMGVQWTATFAATKITSASGSFSRLNSPYWP